MIRAMMNLRCKAGHRFYSPTPAHWLDHECGVVFGTGKTCGEPIRRSRKRRKER